MHPGTADVLNSLASVSAQANMVSASAAEEISKKVRKPYTITKSRESWTDQEHDKFLEALQLFDRDWKKIEAFVGSKTVIQIRSHAQKYFLKVQKNGSGDHVPPPRPKRKSAQPYPQKAAKTALVTQQVSRGVMPNGQAESIYSSRLQPSAVYMPPAPCSPAMPAWVHHMVPPGNVEFMTKGAPTSVSLMHKKDQIGGNGGSAPSTLQHPVVSASRGLPDFAQVYSFIGSVFDPAMDSHLKRMREMAPIDRETVLLLMRNLSINLSSPDFEEHNLFLSVYDMDTENALAGVGNDVKDQTDATDMAFQPCSGGIGDEPASGPPESGGSENTEGIGEALAQVRKSLVESFPENTTEIPEQCYSYDGGGEHNDNTADAPESLCSGHFVQPPRTSPLTLEHSGNTRTDIIDFCSGSDVHGFGAQAVSFESAEEAVDDGVDIWWS